MNMKKKVVKAQVQLVVMLPWALGFNNRFMGHGDYGIMTSKGELLIPNIDLKLAKHIIKVHNDFLKT